MTLWRSDSIAKAGDPEIYSPVKKNHQRKQITFDISYYLPYSKDQKETYPAKPRFLQYKQIRLSHHS